jgi:RNA polymerase sigma-70 factor (ECF subfamily)
VSALSDEQLMQELQQGRTGALDALYSRYASRLYVFCMNSTGSSGQDAEDMVQEVFVRVIKAANTFRPDKAPFRTWLFSIARNRCIDASRRQRVIRFLPIGRPTPQDDSEGRLAPEDVLTDPADDAEQSLIRSSAVQAVRDCIAALENERERQAVLLYYLGGKVYREIAGVLGESLSMARNRVKAAQDKVRSCLERKGIDSPA